MIYSYGLPDLPKANALLARKLLFWGCLIALYGFSTLTQAEQKQEFGDFEVHYIALPSTILDPAIAKQYDIPRSKVAGFLNVAVLKKQPDGTSKPVSAFIRGSVKNLIQQKRDLEFTRIAEANSVYQIASFWYSQGEMMEFNLEIQADPNAGPFRLKFHQALYPD